MYPHRHQREWLQPELGEGWLTYVDLADNLGPGSLSLCRDSGFPLMTLLPNSVHISGGVELDPNGEDGTPRVS